MSRATAPIPLLSMGLLSTGLLSTLAAALLTVLFVPAAAAENLACQTVNGRTVCSRGQGSLSCQTINDKTTCVTGPGALTCETLNGKTTCRRGSGKPETMPELKPLPMPPLTAPMPSMPDQPFGRNFPFEEEVRIDLDGPGMTVRAGALLVRID